MRSCLPRLLCLHPLLPIIVQGQRAHIRVAQCACADAIDAHDQAAGRVGAGDACVGLHPIRRVIATLFGGQQRDRRLKRVEAEVGAVGQRELAAADVDEVANGHRTGAIALDGFHHQVKIVEVELVVAQGER